MTGLREKRLQALRADATPTSSQRSPPAPRLLQLDPHTLWFSSTGQPPATPAAAQRKVEQTRIAL